ncbi:hypothetical protein M8C21_014021 [Ambrosia artemisiifolia]|uniref:Uncharacterized protein n=1 Tax=Ambrosia artemisiifolia TaxID=4212 RepID=A0AAD5C1T4_AMBAR|nr:hypothetical protein M8C21_014021 [Ambrosia artemisiifolia]
MSRLLTQTLIRSSPSEIKSIKFFTPHINRFSTQSKSQLIELDLESDSEVEVLGLRKLEDAIHNIIVRQSAPDWLPFVPGSSYWVPPRRHRQDSQGIVSLLRKFKKPLTDEESLALSSSRGWPSSAYFIEGTSTIHPVPIEMEADVVHGNEEDAPDAKNKEG